MTIELDHTIVRTRDKVASAQFFAHIFGLEADTNPARMFAGVPVNDTLTVYFATSREVPSAHYAFQVDDATFDAIFGRIEGDGLAYGSGPFRPAVSDGQLSLRDDGGRAVYFEDPNGHVLEVLTARREGYELSR